MKKKKIAIIGAGIFGCTLALILNKKFEVHLFEKKNDILNEASKMNQFRFHLGFHYPRSLKTINEVQNYHKDFLKFYGKDIYGKTKNYYSVAKHNSKTSFKKYIKVLKKNKLYYKIINNSHYNYTSDKIKGLILTNEKVLNYFKLKKKINKLLKIRKVKLNLKRELKKKDIKNYYKIFLTTYKNNNLVLRTLGKKPKKKFRYELVEKLIVSLPAKYKKLSMVVLDGNFLCIDPYIGTKYHLLSHVKYSKIKILNSVYPNFSKKLNKLLDYGKLENLKGTAYDKIIRDGSNYLPFLKEAKYAGSFYLVRTIMNNSKKDDDRTHQIDNFSNKIVTILSGKWNTAVTLSHEILNILIGKK
jgi:D-amino-acid oxidase